MPRCLVISNENLFNCWKILKTIKPQRKDEICLIVKVTKVEKINCMRARLNPLLFFKWAISSQASNRGRFNDYPYMGVEPQAIGGSK